MPRHSGPALPVMFRAAHILTHQRLGGYHTFIHDAPLPAAFVCSCLHSGTSGQRQRTRMRVRYDRLAYSCGGGHHKETDFLLVVCNASGQPFLVDDATVRQLELLGLQPCCCRHCCWRAQEMSLLSSNTKNKIYPKKRRVKPLYCCPRTDGHEARYV